MRAARLLIALTLATAIWIPSLHVFFAPRGEDHEALRASLREPLLARQRALFEDPGERERTILRMRRANAEWDFMGRTFLVLSLANEALRADERGDADERARLLAIVDRVIDETLSLEREHGQGFFLLPYASEGAFVQSPARSVFVDGEIALMIAARLAVAPRDSLREPLRERVDAIATRMQGSPVLSLESYPDECWTFCNTVALAALRVSDHVDGRDHGELLRAWGAMARARLLDPETGMLVSSFRYDGSHLDGPEGSSIFLAAHMLSLVDPELADDQYARARAALGQRFAGFGWAREWPQGRRGPMDIDSGPIVPIVDASAGASGMAILGAASFGDTEWLRALSASLELAAFPVREGESLRYAASNQVGDAVMLYAVSEGPLFARVRGAGAGDRWARAAGEGGAR